LSVSDLCLFGMIHLFTFIFFVLFDFCC